MQWNLESKFAAHITHLLELQGLENLQKIHCTIGLLAIKSKTIWFLFYFDNPDNQNPVSNYKQDISKDWRKEPNLQCISQTCTRKLIEVIACKLAVWKVLMVVHHVTIIIGPRLCFISSLHWRISLSFFSFSHNGVCSKAFCKWRQD